MDKIKINIESATYHKMFEYAYFAKKHFSAEIAGWGHLDKERGIYKLAPLTKQYVEGAEVNNFPNDILNDTKYDISDLVVQWHSHVDMGTSPSQPDKENIVNTLKLFPILVSIIVNCKGEYSARLDYKNIGSKNVNLSLSTIQTMDVELVPYYNNSELSKEVLRKCSKPPVKVISVKKVIKNVDNNRHYDDYNRSYNQPLAPFVFSKAKVVMKDISVEYPEIFYVEKDGAAYIYDTKSQCFLSVDEYELTVNGITYGTPHQTIKAFIEKTGIDYPMNKVVL